MISLTRRTLIVAALTGIGATAAHRNAGALGSLRIRDLYDVGAEFSPKALALAGKSVAIKGFMAPPLKPEADFFILTKLPMAACPFCDSELDWPTDIVLVRLRSRQRWADFNQPILVTGRLELGTEIDQETGFVSRVRVVEAEYELA